MGPVALTEQTLHPNALIAMDRIRGWFSVLALLALLPGAELARAQGQIIIGQGAVFDSGEGRIRAGCATLAIDGVAAGRWSDLDGVQLGVGGTLATRELDFGGDWHSEREQRVPGRIHWQPQCGRAEGTLSGSHRFAHLALTGDSGLTRRLAVGSEQWIDQSLRIQGDGSPLVLRSSVPGQAARLTLSADASWQVDRVDVADIDSSGGQGIAPGDPASYRSRDSGGNRNWFLGAVAIPVPMLGPAGLVVLALLMALGGWLQARSSNRCRDSTGGQS